MVLIIVALGSAWVGFLSGEFHNQLKQDKRTKQLEEEFKWLSR